MVNESRRFAVLLCLTGFAAVSAHSVSFAQPAGQNSAEQSSFLDGATDDRALRWAADQTSITVRTLSADPRYQDYYSAALATFLDGSRIPGTDGMAGTLYAGQIYNVWADASHPLGVWQRTPLDSFRARSARWQVLLDANQLASTTARATK